MIAQRDSLVSYQITTQSSCQFSVNSDTVSSPDIPVYIAWLSVRVPGGTSQCATTRDTNRMHGSAQLELRRAAGVFSRPAASAWSAAIADGVPVAEFGRAPPSPPRPTLGKAEWEHARERALSFRINSTRGVSFNQWSAYIAVRGSRAPALVPD